MKKIITTLAAVALAFVLMAGTEAKAAGCTGQMTGPGTARAGETITLNLIVNAQNLTGVNGTFSYDTSKATVNSVSTPLSDWYCGNNVKFLLYENRGDFVGVSGSQTVLRVSLTLAANLTAGEKIEFSIPDCEATYEGEQVIGAKFSVSHIVTVSAPVSTPPTQDTPAQNPTQGAATQNPASQDKALQNATVAKIPTANPTTEDKVSQNEASEEAANDDVKAPDDDIKEATQKEEKKADSQVAIKKTSTGEEGVSTVVLIWLIVIAVIAMACIAGLCILLKKKKEENES